MSSITVTARESVSFEKLAGIAAILAGVVHFLYALAFVVISRSAPETGVFLSALFLLLGGLLSMTAMNGAYHRLKATDGAFALYALLLVSVGTLGAAIQVVSLNYLDELFAKEDNYPIFTCLFQLR